MEKKIKLITASLIPIIVSVIIVISGCKSNNSTYTYPTSPPGGGSPGANEVWMQNIAFVPASKTISVGTTITWTNKDNYPHQPTSGIPNYPDGLFKSGSLNNGDTFSYKFNTAGTFKYYCYIHGAMMTATMIVQ
jgi:plastocyanin